MTVISKKSLLKRITAFVLAILMVFTLMPWESYVTWAEETSTQNCVFTVKNMEGTVVAGAIVEIYKPDSSITTKEDGSYITLAETDENGQTSVLVDDLNKLQADADYYLYHVTADDYTYVCGFFEKTTENIEVVFGNPQYAIETNVEADGQNAGSGIKVYLLKEDTIIDTQITDTDGKVFFMSGVEEGASYTIKAISDTQAGATSADAQKEGLLTTTIALADKTQASISFEKETLVLDFDGTSPVTGTNSITGEPSDWLGEYSYSYSSNTVAVATVDAVTGEVKAVATGEAIITATLTSDEYAETSISYTVKVIEGATITGKVTDKEEPEAVIKGKAYLVGKDTTVDLSAFDPTKITILCEADIVNGTYTFDPIEAGDYKVIIISDGYISRCEEISITVDHVNGSDPVSKDISDFEKDIHDISGAVKDAEGNGIPQMTVSLYKGTVNDADGMIAENLVQTAETDTEGSYTFKDIVSGTYTIVIAHEDYKNVFTPVEVKSADASVANIQLEKRTVVTLDFAKNEIILFKNGDLTFENTLSIKNGETSVSLDGWDIKYSVSPESVITLGNGLAISAVKDLGTAQITVTASHEDYKVDANSELSFTVYVYEFCFENVDFQNEYLNSVSASEPITRTYNDEFSGKAVVKDAEGNVVTTFTVAYTLGESVDTDVTIDENGTVKVVGTPNDTPTTITASIPEGENYKEISLFYDLKVVNKSLGDYVFDWDYTFEDNDDKKVTFKYSEKNNNETVKQIKVNEGLPTEVTVHYEVTSGNAVSVDENGILTINSVGKATIQASMESSIYETVAPITYTVEITEGEHDKFAWDVVVNDENVQVVDTLNVTYEDALDIKTTGQYDNAEVTYSVVSENNAVSYNLDTKKFEINCVGTATITATIPAGNGYAEKTLTCTVNVAQEPQDELNWNINGADINPTEERTYGNAGFTISITDQNDNDELTHAFESSDPNVASVDENGNVTIKKVGETEITYTSADANDNFVPKTLSFKLVVGKNPQEDLKWSITDFDNTGETKEVDYLPNGGANFTIGIIGQIETSELKYGFSSSNENVATVDEYGNVMVLHAGTTVITYVSEDNSDDTLNNYTRKELSYTLVVNKADQDGLKWGNGYTDKQKINITYEPSKTITNVLAVGKCNEAEVTYSSDNTDVAIVDKNTGEVKIKNVGTVTITATADVPDTGNYNDASISYTYIITPSEHTSFRWQGGNPGTVELTYEDEIKHYVAVGQCEDSTVTYSSNNPDVASVHPTTGVVTILKAGKAKITATAGVSTSGNYVATEISYNIIVSKKQQTMSFTQETYTLINGYNQFVSPVIAKQNVAATAGKIVYSVPENNGVATIDPVTGELTFTLQPGTVTVTATKPTDEQYIGVETTYTLTVLEWDPLKNGATSTYYTVTGTQEDASSSWFTHYSKNDPVQLTAGTGYALYKSEKDPVPNTKWSSAISVSNVHEGKDNTITFYVKDTVNGYVSKQYTVNNIKVDSVVPNASIAIDDVKIWEKILSFFTFDLLGQDTPELKITSSDKTSGVKAVYYYISNTTEPLESKGLIDVNALEKEADWKNYGGAVDLGDEEVTKNVIYAKVVDKAGNSTYVATNGLIFDGTKPVVTPTVLTKAVNGYYNKNVKIELDVVDAEPYSGIKEITYVVENAGKVTDSGTLYTFEPKEEDNPKHSELLSKWNSDDYNKNVIVDASENNSDDVKVTFTVTDNAGNTTESVVELKIDITDPVISVVYNNNNGDTAFADGVYFNADRTATITVSERHFNKADFVLTITNSDGTIPELSKWTKTSKGTGNGDDTTYTATVYFGADGDYTLDISYVDEAGNKCGDINYGESLAPTAFTIDKTVPTISISYDNNDALNENYFKADRIATIVIQEHNFDASRVNALITATDNGEPIAAPVISGWSTSGDTHTATISYASDALYTFDIEYLDKAGNSIADVAEQSFYVDKTMPQVSITEIVDQSANNEEQIGFVITATDTNFDVFTPVLTAVLQTENGITTTELSAGSISEITNGQIYTVENLDADGIYSISCTVVDKAGNAYTEVNLQREDGSTYVENRAAEDTLLMFSVNRGGSTFAVDDDTQNVLDSEYIQNVENDIVIYEVNTNELVSYALTLNGVELTEGTDYTISSSGGNGTWMRYTYTVNKDLFEEEGEYILVVSSTDGAENDAFSDVKNANISFVVDRTAPIVTVTGMESNRSYQTDVQTVTVMPTDDGGIIESLIINFVDRDGNVTDEIFAKSGDELRELLETNGGLITFELSDVVNTNIQIICSDKSYGANGQSNTFNQIYENITVSASAVAIFFAGNTIYYILGGTGAVVALGVGAGIFLKKRKSSKVKND